MRKRQDLSKVENKMFDWINIIVPHARVQLYKYFEREGHKPTLRTLYYILLDEGLVPGTEYGYKKLSSSIVAAKRADTFPEDAFIDATRVVAANFRTLDRYVTPEAFVTFYRDYLKSIVKHYTIPRWLRQPHFVIVWIEKATMLNIFESILEKATPPRNVSVAVNRGNAGYQKFTDRCDELVDLLDEITIDEKYGYNGRSPVVHILYFGDYDPSGDNMSRYLSRYLAERKGLQKYEVYLERIAVNPEQIAHYNLHLAPQDLDTMQKLWADPNIAAFSRRLKSSPLYGPVIKPKLESDPDYLYLKSQVIDHPKTIQQLLRRAGEIPKKGLKANPANYERLRAAERQKILREYDFVVVEIDALAAKMHNIFSSIILEAVDKYFDGNLYQEMLNDEIHSPEAIQRLVCKKFAFLDNDPEDEDVERGGGDNSVD